MKIKVEKILPNPEQPRKDFDDLDSLVESIRDVGLLQPVTVERLGEDYVLIDGERRWRAHKKLGLAEIEANIKESLFLGTGDINGKRLELAMVANLQRKDMSPVEEARGYERLRQMGWSSAEIARKVGISIPTVMFRLGLLKLEPEVQELIGKRLIPLDPTALPLIMQLPKDVQVKLCRKFAANHTPAGYIRGVCRRFLNNPENKYGGGGKRIKKSDIPMFEVASVSKREYDIAAAVGSLPPWEKLSKAAKEACDECSLSEVASMSICKECPAVDLVRRLLK